MIRDLIPWNVLTRGGLVPPMKVSRRPLRLGEIVIEVGERFDPEVFPLQIRAERLRQFYEARLLEPLDAPKDSRQFYREQLARQRGQEIPGQEVPVAPIPPVASRIVADELPAVEVPVVEDTASKRRPKGAK